MYRYVFSILVASAPCSVTIGYAAERVETSAGTLAVVEVARGLEFPWSLAFLPDGRMLVTERPGRLRLIDAGGLVARPIDGLPHIVARGQGGLLDVRPHPAFAENQLVYFSYSGGDGAMQGTEVARARLDCGSGDCALSEWSVIFRQQPGSETDRHYGSRLVFDGPDRLYVTLGDRGLEQHALDLGMHLGKVVRITADGGVPPDNPFVGTPGAAPEIWTYGNRNVQGAALHPESGLLYTHEHGPQGGDELNVLRAGGNHGWPRITYGRTYGLGLPIGEGTEAPDVVPPLWYWIPSIAPSGLVFYTGDRYPNWHGSLFLCGMKPALLVRLELDGERVLSEERIAGLGRLRDVRQGPDGWLYVLSESEGKVLRLEAIGR